MAGEYLQGFMLAWTVIEREIRRFWSKVLFGCTLAFKDFEGSEMTWSTGEQLPRWNNAPSVLRLQTRLSRKSALG